MWAVDNAGIDVPSIIQIFFFLVRSATKVIDFLFKIVPFA